MKRRNSEVKRYKSAVIALSEFVIPCPVGEELSCERANALRVSVLLSVSVSLLLLFLFTLRVAVVHRGGTALAEEGAA